VRSYRQVCPVARALDAVGDRWSLLIVRELMTSPRRYRDLLDGLPGVATNLLASRLRDLEAAGVVERPRAPLGAYRLSDRGAELAPVVAALARWGEPLVDGEPGDAVARAHWIALHARSRIRAGAGPPDPMVVVFDTGEDAASLVVDGDGARIEPGVAPGAAVRLTGPAHALIAFVASGALAPGEGVRIDADEPALARLRELL
jgi:DNA-binding HxlR family transcriptional regulator